jgi:hypothetical protein
MGWLWSLTCLFDYTRGLVANRRKFTISDMLGWLLGICCIILSIMHANSFDPRIGIFFGIAVITLISWTRKTRNEASDDMNKAERAGAEAERVRQEAGWERKLGGWFGVALTMLTSWTRKIRNDASDDHEKAERAAAEAEKVRQEADRERKLRKMPPASAASSYSILELNENATEMEIKRAFRKLVKRYHPDRSRYSALTNAEKFRQVQEAYAVLRDHRGFSGH